MLPIPPQILPQSSSILYVKQGEESLRVDTNLNIVKELSQNYVADCPQALPAMSFVIVHICRYDQLELTNSKSFFFTTGTRRFARAGETNSI